MFFINGVKGQVLRAILDFMYMGEVHIKNEDLIDFIELAEQFKIRGVTKENSVCGYNSNNAFLFFVFCPILKLYMNNLM